MNTTEDPPTTGTRPRPTSEKPALRIVNGEEEVTRRRRWLAELAARKEPTAEGLPPIHDLDDIKGTWLADLFWSKRRGSKDDAPTYVPASHTTNAITILVHDPRWRDVLAYDEFAESIVTRRRPPWHATDACGSGLGEWTEEDAVRCESWFQRAYSMRIGDKKIMGAVAVAARSTTVHPVREYLRSLEWDGAPRIDTWLVTLLGAADTPYTRAVGRLWLISAVARVMRPGCKVDTMLVLEGKTGIRKSTALRALAGDAWFTEVAGGIDPRETPQLLRRKWIVELSELASLRRTKEQEVIKGFLSRQEDNYRPPYGWRARDFPRQSVFAGTTNADRYLADPTGARRFWPVRCGKIFLRGIEIERDQLWAEAVRAYDAGERWHIESDDLVRDSVAEQSERFEEDAWTEIVREYCEVRKGMGVTTEELFSSCLCLEIGNWGVSESMRVGAILRRIGWGPVGRTRPRRYKPEEASS